MPVGGDFAVDPGALAAVSSPLSPVQEAPTSGKLGTHYLLTVLGTRPTQARYVLDGKICEAQLAPIALMELLSADQRPDTVVALCTQQARVESFPLLNQALAATSTVIPVDVPSGHGQAHIDAFLKQATGAIPATQEDALRLSMDVTHGYRHFSFLTYLAGLYLVGLRHVDLMGAWYGLLQRDADCPFLDLRPLLRLPGWIHALQVLQTTGSTLPLATVLEAGLHGKDARNAATIAQQLHWISKSRLSALPIELGLESDSFLSQRLKPLTALLRNAHQLPLAQELVNQLSQQFAPFALSPAAGGSRKKSDVRLTHDELQRQAELIDQLFEQGDEAVALGLLNEWTVSWALWCLDATADWLTYNPTRRMAASRLGAISAARKNQRLSAELNVEQQELGYFWVLLGDWRNAFAHHGMRAKKLIGRDSEVFNDLARLKAYWSGTLKDCPRISLRLEGQEGAPILVTPIGNRPGVLFSALHVCRERCGMPPASCHVICSPQSRAWIAEATSRSGYEGRIRPLVLSDPYGGVKEIERLKVEVERDLLLANEVHVNVTGGTTLMGLAAQALADHARTFARPVQRFGLIDQRSPQEQLADPYQPGDPIWLNDSEMRHAHTD